MIDVDALLVGAIAAITLFLAALGVVAALRSAFRPRRAPNPVDWRTHRR